jgi:hypothetical protein
VAADSSSAGGGWRVGARQMESRGAARGRWQIESRGMAADGEFQARWMESRGAVKGWAEVDRVWSWIFLALCSGRAMLYDGPTEKRA